MPHPRAPNITPPPAALRLPPNQIPRMRHCRQAETPAPGLRPAIPASPQHQGLGNSPSPARILRAALLRSSIPGSTPLRFPLRVRFPLRTQVSAPRWKQQQRAGRACVRARVRACVCVCVCAGGPPRSPARPLLPSALHAAMPAESLTRAPTRLRSHTRARACNTLPHPQLHTSDSPSWGAHKGLDAPAPRSSRSAACGAE